ncbi:MAG: hypothetical protein M3O15_08020 [Acidobacteriota bacterium]|nr:hypothetical protein [Acidobacteriota bacterium]
MDFKAFSDGLDKLTDILNVGRLIFYTAAGFCVSLPLAMGLRMLAHEKLQPYWGQFLSDMAACAKHPGVWLIALVLGFLVASVAGAVVDFDEPPHETFDKESYSYQFPRLFSGGVHDKGTSKDYAAWLISEYYRYFEIVLYIPSGILVALPIFAVYPLLYIVRSSANSPAFSFTAAHWAIALWTLGTVVAWGIVWPRFWRPNVVKPIYETWVSARRSTIAGLQEFVTDSTAKAAQPPPSEK